MQMQYQLSENAAGLNDAQLATDDHFVSEGIKKTVEAFSNMIEFSEKFAQLNGLAVRIAEALEVFEELVEEGETLKPLASPLSDDRTEIHLDNVDLVTPLGTCLAAGLTLSVTPNRALMVTGVNASGKSGFARLLGGLWPMHRGELARPHVQSSEVVPIFLVPQRAYSVVGSLADQVACETMMPFRFDRGCRLTLTWKLSGCRPDPPLQGGEDGGCGGSNAGGAGRGWRWVPGGA
jgi:ABC-type transport system involved in cytochrome bd biosynthesis fused ATPase/permease subunit